MKKSPQTIVIAAVVVILALVVGFLVHWRPAKTIARKQAALISAIEDRKGARIRRLVSTEYKDRWGFTAEDITTTMMDARGQYMVFTITQKQLSLAIEGDRGTVTTRLEVGGTSMGPGGGEITKRINRLGKPFIFIWEKQNFLPNSWQLVKLENEEIPDNAWGYKPGSLENAIDNF